MNRLELSTRLHRPDPAGRGIRRGTPSVGLSESVEGLALQSTDPGAAESTSARRLRGQPGPTTGRGIVEGFHLLPALLGSLEEHRLAIVSRGDEGLFRRKAERLVRQRVGADDLDRRGRLAGSARVDDADGRVVACAESAKATQHVSLLTGKRQDISRGRKGNIVNPAAVGTGKFATNGVEGQLFTPDAGLGPERMGQRKSYQGFCARPAHFASTPLIKAEKTLALPSAPPAASSTPLLCQSMDKTVDLRGFFKCLDVHQLFSSSNEQTATDLDGVSMRAGVCDGVHTSLHFRQQISPRWDST